MAAAKYWRHRRLPQIDRENIMKYALFGFSLLLASSASLAGEALEHLEHFLSHTKNLKADFSQTLEDSSGRQLQQQTGTVVLQRPNRFVWHYQQPYEQQLVADGRNLWHYDVDLEQVSVRPLDEALGAAPIALLSSDTPLKEQFVITELGKIDGRFMVQLEAKVKDTDYGFALLAFDAQGQLDIMQLKDPMGQVTTIDLDNLASNTAIEPGTFDFVAPEGVDVVGQPVDDGL